MKNESQFPIIETERLTLRKPSPRDAKALLELTRDEAVMKYYGMASFRDEDEALEEIEWFNGLFAQSKGIRWIITKKGRDSYIGDIGLHNYVPAHARAELGFKLARAYWRQGLMTEAVEGAVTYGFAEMRLNRIEAVVDPRNAASLGMLRNAGFQEEGLLREYEHEPGGFVDVVMLSLLRRERGE